MNSKQDYIAVFDSGVGGISVLRQLRRILPRERFLYYGDSANAPYGVRSNAQIMELTMTAAEHLLRLDVKALVVACNTATAVAIEALRSRWPDKIIIGIEPALKLAADRFPGGAVGVMATPVTLREEKFSHLLERCADRCRVTKLPITGLVELIEAGELSAAEALLSPVLGPHAGKLDAVVLGCTHYPFAAEAISRILGPGTVLLDGGEGTAQQTRRRLAEAGLLSDGPGGVVFENSAADPKVLALCRRLADCPE